MFSLFLPQVEMVFLGTSNLLAASLSVMPYSMYDRMSHFSFKVFVSSLRLKDIFVSTTLRTTSRLFFSFTVKFLVLIQIRFLKAVVKYLKNTILR